MELKQLGLSKKTNIAIAAMTMVNLAKDSWWAIIAISVIALTAGTYQYLIDRKTP